MNKTISIYMQPTGSTMMVDIPCRLYKGSYKDKQIEVYVPKSMLYETTNDPSMLAELPAQDVPAQLDGSALLTTITIGAILTAENGTQTTTIPYYPNYDRDEIVTGHGYTDNVLCSVFTIPMPNTFTAFIGTQTMVVNIVNIDNSTPASPIVLQITTSQTSDITVNQSAYVSTDEEIDASIVEQLQGEIVALQADVATKQDIQDATLPAPYTVSGSINAINELASSNASTIETQGQAITSLQDDVAELQAKVAGAEVPVGSMSGTTMPTNAQLTAFTVEETGEQPEPNNVIIFTLVVTGGTDRVFKYIYVNAEDGWMYYEIPALEHASNGTYGSIQGTYGIDSTNNILVNIADGEIVDIYYKDSDGVYQNIRASINLIKDTQTGMIDGSQVVAIATKAVQDQLGNVINTTYAQASTVYTKTESDAKYLAKTYTNVYYYATSGLVDDVPNTPASGIQFTQLVNTIGETLLCDCGRTTVGDYHFTKNSSDNSSIVLATDVACTLQFRLETYANSTVLAADLSDVLTFAANTPQTLDITSIYSGLGTTEIDVPAGSTISKKLYAISTDTTEKNVYLYSNATYPSTYQLNAQSIVLTVNTINGLKAVPIAQSEWTDNGDDTYTVTVAQTRHQQPASTKYFLELQKQVTANSYQYIAFTPIVDDAGNITITTNEAIDCILLIGSNLSTDEKGIITVTNPTVAQEIDYNLYGAMKVTQTTQPVDLSLLAPTDTSKFYAFFITNDTNSTETINWNGEDIAPGSGLQFRWDGAQWIVGEQPTSTTEIYDDANDQLLSTTINQMQSGINTNANDITIIKNKKINNQSINTFSNLQINADRVIVDDTANIYNRTAATTDLSLSGLLTNQVWIQTQSAFYNEMKAGRFYTFEIMNTSNVLLATASGVFNGFDNSLFLGAISTIDTVLLTSKSSFVAIKTDGQKIYIAASYDVTDISNGANLPTQVKVRITEYKTQTTYTV